MMTDVLGEHNRWVSSDNFKELPPFLQQFMLAGAELLTFDYSPEQWVEVTKSLHPLKSTDKAIEKARELLVGVARSIFLDKLNAHGDKVHREARLKHWTKAVRLAVELMSELSWLARDEVNNARWLAHDEVNNGPPDLSCQERHPYEDRMEDVIIAMARSRAAADRIDDGFPQSTVKSRYHFVVLQVWTELGGELKFSRHPTTGKIKGPLVRYFSAVTRPVHGGSPESLPDILKRHAALKAALDKRSAK